MLINHHACATHLERSKKIKGCSLRSWNWHERSMFAMDMRKVSPHLIGICLTDFLRMVRWCCSYPPKFYLAWWSKRSILVIFKFVFVKWQRYLYYAIFAPHFDACVNKRGCNQVNKLKCKLMKKRLKMRTEKVLQPSQ